jgi:hypothetical protein
MPNGPTRHALPTIPFLAALLGCSSTPPEVGGGGGAGTTTVGAGGAGSSTATIASTASTASTSAGAGGAGGSAAETWPKACADVYDPDVLPTFDLTFAPEQLAGLQADCAGGVQQYRPVTFTYDGEAVPAMARLKGNWSWTCDKMQFVISFNELDPDGRFHGLRKIVLDAPWYDWTLLHERVAFPIFAARGLPYSCVNNARLTIDGQYYGLYANLERIDREYLERNFEEPDGNLYQAGVELKTNEDVGDTSDLAALNGAATLDELGQRMDLDQAVAEWATEAMIPAMDNYWAGVEINHYLYSHPSRGFLYLPYDLDISFGDSGYPGGGLIWPESVASDPITYQHPGWLKEERVKWVLSDPFWCERFVEELTLSRAAYSPVALRAQVDAWSAQIAQALADDPRKPFSTGAHDAAISAMKDFFQARADFVDQWLAQGGHCPASF